MKPRMSGLMKKEATRSILASILSIIIGLVVGCVIILIVGMTSDTLSPSSAWDGIRLIFGGLFSTGRDAAGALTFGFNPTSIRVTMVPIRYCPGAPILNRPVLKATATESPVRIKGVARDSI